MVRRPDHRRQHRRRDLLHHLRPRRVAEAEGRALGRQRRRPGPRLAATTARPGTNVTAEHPRTCPTGARSRCIEPSPHRRRHGLRRRRRPPPRRLTARTCWKTTDFGKTWTEPDRQAAAGRLPARRPRGPEAAGPAVPRHRARRVVLARRRRDLAAAEAEPADRRRHTTCVVKDNDLVVGTNGRSIWILDDLTPLRRVVAEVGGRGRTCSRSQPAIRWRYHGANYAGEDRIPGDNPPKGAVAPLLPRRASRRAT